MDGWMEGWMHGVELRLVFVVDRWMGEEKERGRCSGRGTAFDFPAVLTATHGDTEEEKSMGTGRTGSIQDFVSCFCFPNASIQDSYVEFSTTGLYKNIVG
jgi:hypothetical protein